MNYISLVMLQMILIIAVNNNNVGHWFWCYKALFVVSLALTSNRKKTQQIGEYLCAVNAVLKLFPWKEWFVWCSFEITEQTVMNKKGCHLWSKVNVCAISFKQQKKFNQMEIIVNIQWTLVKVMQNIPWLLCGELYSCGAKNIFLCGAPFK